jgi:hypothetical protein
MTHPDLDTEITVDTAAEAIHENSGWKRSPDQDDIPYESLPADVARFEGQDQVRLQHPNVAEIITVGADAVPFHQSNGWVRVEEAAKQERETRTVAELKDEIRTLNESRDADDQLPVSGTKDELLERLTQAQQISEPPAAPADQEDEA